uniref:Protein kinase domain-containing protein n=1 Tax=Chromera velia CCMP2878 TaxID=1169474 RepID=A0A0G4F116_9ALVE|eukprot:Cvel_14513.t1-p1 / transcript=Cvel_14513.t1 / gene=Cvel_14513 / organism=Chromera_velia_CCMP2878 / gene_product=Death-associated protein kinase 3, putative / transcript_product=Death-associated protein kinase 3, putative / location=Cvel_scaffold1036:9275-15398(+) / protein_length=811 / sequence_SO=supercontig / SO=protein_coding / is_pseudo=false
MNTSATCKRSVASFGVCGDSTNLQLSTSAESMSSFDSDQPPRSIEVIPAGKSLEDYFSLGPPLQVCKPGSTRPVLMEVVDRENGATYIAKIIKKERIPRCSGGESLWRRLLTVLLCLPEHRNVMTVDRVFETNDAYCILSEKLMGGELFNFLLTERAVPEETCKHIMRQIFRSVGHLHQNHLIHRDVKPENLVFRYARDSVRAMAGPGGQFEGLDSGALNAVQHELVLIDFDTCRMTDIEFSMYNDVTDGRRRLVGTYGYLAPEILRGQEVTLAADMWSIGVILFILMTINFDVPPLPTFPKAQDLCRRLLVWAPEHRMESCARCLEHAWLTEVPEPLLPELIRIRSGGPRYHHQPAAVHPTHHPTQMQQHTAGFSQRLSASGSSRHSQSQSPTSAAHTSSGTFPNFILNTSSKQQNQQPGHNLRTGQTNSTQASPTAGDGMMGGDPGLACSTPTSSSSGTPGGRHGGGSSRSSHHPMNFYSSASHNHSPGFHLSSGAGGGVHGGSQGLSTSSQSSPTHPRLTASRSRQRAAASLLGLSGNSSSSTQQQKGDRSSQGGWGSSHTSPGGHSHHHQSTQLQQSAGGGSSQVVQSNHPHLALISDVYHSRTPPPAEEDSDVVMEAASPTVPVPASRRERERERPLGSSAADPSGIPGPNAFHPHAHLPSGLTTFQRERNAMTQPPFQQQQQGGAAQSAAIFAHSGLGGHASAVGQQTASSAPPLSSLSSSFTGRLAGHPGASAADDRVPMTDVGDCGGSGGGGGTGSGGVGRCMSALSRILPSSPGRDRDRDSRDRDRGLLQDVGVSRFAFTLI